jgi:4-hydroxy-L-threonine phosphate dehydrogenase PdxA
MKLRIKGNSLRLRLTRGEVERLANAEQIVESIKFGIGEREQLVYSLEPHTGEYGITAHYEHRSIIVRLPVDMARQ